MPNENSQADGTVPRLAGSVAQAIAEYQNGNGDSLGQIINAYFALLLTKARVRLGSFRQSDQEGLVQSTFGSFLGGAMEGQYPGLNHRDELRRLLATIMHRKIAHAIRDETTEIAGDGRVQNEPEGGLLAAGGGPDPLEEAICREWLAHMDEKGLLKEARLVWEGHHYHEIAEELGIPEPRARRLITLVKAETRVFFSLENEK
jgi:DNA-directed RNA polymerase specialized sigma24 family protein